MGDTVRIGDSKKLRKREAEMRMRSKRYCEICIIREVHGHPNKRFCCKRCVNWNFLVNSGATTLEHARRVLSLQPGKIFELAKAHKEKKRAKDSRFIATGRKTGQFLAATRGSEYFRAIRALRKGGWKNPRPEVQLAYQIYVPKPYPANLSKQKRFEINRTDAA